MTVEVSKPIPAFEIEATSDKTISTKDLLGTNWVIYFYPKDSTPGCTTEGQNFRDAYQEFKEANCEIFGISREGLRSHENFKAKQSFPFELLSDPDEMVCQLFDVIKEKKMYGKTFMGIERSTFLIDAEGALVAEWRKVKVTGHVDEVLEKVKSLKS